MRDALARPSARDRRRAGERLILVTTLPNVRRSDVQARMKELGATELMVPAEILNLDALPLLGSGKTDYVELNRQVRAQVASQGAA